MKIDRVAAGAHLKAFAFKSLFIEELGWNHCALNLPSITVGGTQFALQPVAEKHGLAVFVVQQKTLPDYRTRREIERSLAKSVHEHLIIFCDDAKSAQIWQWVKRETGRPVACREHHLAHGQQGEALLQKLDRIVFSFEDEEALRIGAVAGAVKQAFDIDRVTKRFYDRFQKEHVSFLELIDGLPNLSRDWYASLMLNRLMFIYFIQKKGFLDGDVNYLPNKLKQVQASRGKGKFHTFYRSFLLKLFHDGLGGKPPRSKQIEALIGRVPYLNGGLFDPHQLERDNPDIEIPDEAFERIFAFFDAYQWHLDDRPLRNDTEINPDVLGYIFEKYINQKQMGAYYTKEDITEYISKSTVITHLLQRASLRCKVAFDGESSVWKLLVKDPDRYLFPALKTGVLDAKGKVVSETLLPDFVQAGMRDPKARIFERRYNLGEAEFATATGKRGTLPTETWREYVERRARCLAVREQLAQGKVRGIDNLVTLNLDLRQFMQDVIDTCEGPELLRAIWQAIVGHPAAKAGERFRHGIAILDPACGSGAFLFAALGILEPLYEACLDRMASFVDDAARLGRKNAFPDFEAVLGNVGGHPSRRYFIYKSIILHNLFGVDIMPEAVEICKLRLFLKLVSQASTDQELEPLPDIDFNIRAGNTLVGYATEAHFDASNTLASDQDHRVQIRASTKELADLFERFREQQTAHDGLVTAAEKHELGDKLSSLSLELDRYLARDYGIDPERKKAFATWREGFQPFHWFAEFYSVMREGGFDVVMGNPPYIQLQELVGYEPRGYTCSDCGNIYPLFLERALSISTRAAKQGFIVPVSSISTDGYSSLQEKYRSKRVHVSCYDDRPSRLFDGLEHIRLVIFLLSGDEAPAWISTRYHKWNHQERETLFQRLSYVPAPEMIVRNSVPKLTSTLELSILTKLAAVPMTVGTRVVRSGRYSINFSRKVGYFLQIVDFQPRVVDGAGNIRPPSEFKPLVFSTEAQKSSVLALLNSNLFYWFMTVFSDCRHLNKREVDAMPFPSSLSEQPKPIARLKELSANLMANLRRTAETRTMRFKHDRLEIECLIPKRSKQLIDGIDLEVAKAFGFTDEEVDFVVNYDIKYRLGDAGDSDD